jgi:hypothetical protein
MIWYGGKSRQCEQVRVFRLDRTVNDKKRPSVRKVYSHRFCSNPLVYADIDVWKGCRGKKRQEILQSVSSFIRA